MIGMQGGKKGENPSHTTNLENHEKIIKNLFGIKALFPLIVAQNQYIKQQCVITLI